MGKDNKIVSRFYVIYGDNAPIYVGYTNRTVKQRFKEHQNDKDFNIYSKVEVKEVDRLAFDFTWDMVQVNENAKQVSERESKLIAEYGTSNSVYQKGLGAIQGGQTWVSVKSFVHNNKNNPKYRGMNSKELLAYLDSYRKRIAKLRNFITRYRDPRLTKLRNFIGNYHDPRLTKLSHFISHYQDYRLSKLSNFISNYQDPRLIKISNFISHYQNHRVQKLSSFISNYKDCRLIKLSGFISHYKDPRLDKLSGFISSYKDYRLEKLHGFITRYKDPRLDKLSSFISNYRDLRLNKLSNFISHYKNK